MTILKFKDYDELSTPACQLIVDGIKTIKTPVPRLATVPMRSGWYDRLIEPSKHEHASFKYVTTFNLDEYIELAKDYPNSYHFFMSEKLFNHIDISPEKTYVPNGVASDLKQEAVDYERLIQKENGIDLQVLGLGTNGHIAFNEPGTKFSSRTDIVDLAQATLDANARFFDSIDEVPTQAVTMGIESIMEGREIVLLVSGEGKAEALKSTINGEVTEDFPASILQTHQNVTIIADEAALSLI